MHLVPLPFALVHVATTAPSERAPAVHRTPLEVPLVPPHFLTLVVVVVVPDRLALPVRGPVTHVPPVLTVQLTATVAHDEVAFTLARYKC